MALTLVRDDEESRKRQVKWRARVERQWMEGYNLGLSCPSYIVPPNQSEPVKAGFGAGSLAKRMALKQASEWLPESLRSSVVGDEWDEDDSED